MMFATKLGQSGGFGGAGGPSGRFRKFGAKITGGNGIPAGSGSFLDTLGGIRKDLGSFRAYFSELVSNSTIWGAGD